LRKVLFSEPTFSVLICYRLQFSKKMFTIEKITAAATYPIRHAVLRKGEAFEKCIYPGDDSDLHSHFGLFEGKELVGVVSIYQTKNALFADDKQFQIRGMAVLDAHQKKGYGAALLQHAESYLKREEQYTIWFNARIIALDFYKKMGFIQIGEPYEIDTIGIHYTMYKKELDVAV